MLGIAVGELQCVLFAVIGGERLAVDDCSLAVIDGAVNHKIVHHVTRRLPAGHIAAVSDLLSRQCGDCAQVGHSQTSGVQPHAEATRQATIADEQTSLVAAQLGGCISDGQWIALVAAGRRPINRPDRQAEHGRVVAIDGHRQVTGQIVSLNIDGDIQALAQCHLAEINLCVLHGRDQFWWAINDIVTAGEHFTTAVAPDVFHQVRKVNERVAVVLTPIDGIISFLLLVTHRIFSCPTQQQVNRPLVECEPRPVAHHPSVFPLIVLIGTCHIHIGTRKVTFVAVIWLEDGASASTLPRTRRSSLGHTIVKVSARHLAQWIVQLSSISLSITGIEMIQIGVGDVSLAFVISSPPALGHRVLLVHTAGAISQSRAKVIGIVAVHVPNTSVIVGHTVGLREVGPQAAIAMHCTLNSQVVYGILQCLSTLACQRAIVAHWYCSLQHCSQGDS